MPTLEEQNLLKVTNFEALKSRQSLISVGKVLSGGIASQETKSGLTQLPGTVSVVKNTRDLIGTDTKFTQLSVGTILDISGANSNYAITQIVNDTSLVVDIPFIKSFEDSKFRKINSYLNPLFGSKDVISVNELFPHNLREDAQTLIEFLRQYYTSENATDLSGISVLFNTLYERRDVDLIDVEDIRILQNWFKEFAKTIHSSKNLKIDPRTFLKHARTLYREKGSKRGIESFFRLLFNENIDVYLPWEDVLIASDGKWDDTTRSRIALDGYSSELKGFTLGNGSFMTNDGFLSDRIYLEDSFYYQQYSYDIRSQMPEQEWLNLFKILLHPAGFIVFSTLLLAISSKTGKMPQSQAFGYIADIFRRINIQINLDFSMRKQIDSLLSIKTSLEALCDFRNDVYLRYTFYSGESIEEYPQDLSIEQLLYSNIFNVGSTITQTYLGSPL